MKISEKPSNSGVERYSLEEIAYLIQKERYRMMTGERIVEVKIDNDMIIAYLRKEDK